MPEIIEPLRSSAIVTARPTDAAAEATAQMLAAMHTDVGAWHDFAAATQDVAGNRRDITTLVCGGPSALRGGLDRAFQLDAATRHMTATYDVVLGAQTALGTARDDFASATAHANVGAGNLVSQRMADAASSMLPSLDVVRRRSGVTALRAAGAGSAIGGVGGLVFGGAGALTYLGQAAGSTELLLAGGIPAAGAAVLALAGTAGSILSNDVEAPGGAIVTGLAAAVRAAVDDQPAGKRLDELPTRRAVGRIVPVSQNAADIARRLGLESDQLSEFMTALQDQAAVRERHEQSVCAQQAVTEQQASQRAQTNVEDWRKALGVSSPTPALPAGS